MKDIEDFRKFWVGRQFRCCTTGVILTIPDNVRPKEFFQFGDSYIDVGDDYYFRAGGKFEEIEVFEDGTYVVLSSGGQGQ